MTYWAAAAMAEDTAYLDGVLFDSTSAQRADGIIVAVIGASSSVVLVLALVLFLILRCAIEVFWPAITVGRHFSAASVTELATAKAPCDRQQSG